MIEIRTKNDGTTELVLEEVTRKNAETTELHLRIMRLETLLVHCDSQFSIVERMIPAVKGVRDEIAKVLFPAGMKRQ